jgi:hypothetical protein
MGSVMQSVQSEADANILLRVVTIPYKVPTSAHISLSVLAI